jgi:hypothetical protein
MYIMALYIIYDVRSACAAKKQLADTLEQLDAMQLATNHRSIEPHTRIATECYRRFRANFS